MSNKGPGLSRDCRHAGKHHHGTPEAYARDNCRCTPCREAHAAEARRRRRLIAYGRYTKALADAAPARSHLLALRSLGIRTTRIERRTGISHTTILAILNGKQARVLPRTERAILACPLDPAVYEDRRKGDPTGTARRLQALMRIGYSGRVLGAMTGMHPQTVNDIVQGRERISARNREKVAEVYDRIWDKPLTGATPSERMSIGRTKRAAERNGWTAPLCWDDDTIDNPAAKPIEARTANRLTKATTAVIEDLDWLRRTGVEPEHAPKRLGITRNALLKALNRHGETRLYNWLTRKDAA